MYYHDSHNSQDCYVLHLCVCHGHHAKTQFSKSIQGVGLVRMIISSSYTSTFFFFSFNPYMRIYFTDFWREKHQLVCVLARDRTYHLLVYGTALHPSYLARAPLLLLM